jgi:hypothetical protein
LARVKERLIDTQRKLQAALFENDQLKKQAAGTTQAGQYSSFRVERTSSNEDPYGHCNILGIDPKRLFGMQPGQAQRVVSGLRRIYATFYHPDVNSQTDPTILKAINDAADKILTRLETGSWGRN